MKEIDGTVELTAEEKTKAIEGMRIMMEYCESSLGCNDCPFLELAPTTTEGVFARSCMLSVRPCGWTIPQQWDEEAEK